MEKQHDAMWSVVGGLSGAAALSAAAWTLAGTTASWGLLVAAVPCSMVAGTGLGTLITSSQPSACDADIGAAPAPDNREPPPSVRQRETFAARLRDERAAAPGRAR